MAVYPNLFSTEIDLNSFLAARSKTEGVCPSASERKTQRGLYHDPLALTFIVGRSIGHSLGSSVGPLVRPSVGPSVHSFVHRLHFDIGSLRYQRIILISEDCIDITGSI